MTTPPPRTISPGGFAARQELSALLTSVWVAEAIRPSELLVIAAPTLSDGPVLDNRAGGFSGLEPSWSERVLRLSDLVLRVLVQGGEVWLLTREHPDGPNRLLKRVRESAAEAGFTSRLKTAEVKVLPRTGAFGDGYAVTGPIALTDHGPDFIDEVVAFEFPRTGTTRTTLQAAFGGLLT